MRSPRPQPANQSTVPYMSGSPMQEAALLCLDPRVTPRFLPAKKPHNKKPILGHVLQSQEIVLPYGLHEVPQAHESAIMG
jgi:hypothetical protein